MRSDRSHANYNGAQVTGVEKREVKIPIVMQKKALDMDKKMFGVAAPGVGGRGACGSSMRWAG
jgi:hypothetical protein